MKVVSPEWVNVDEYSPDPTLTLGDQVIFYPNYMPLHSTLTWNDIVPSYQQEHNHGDLRLLIPSPYGKSLVIQNEIVYDYDDDSHNQPIDLQRSSFIPTFVTHTTQHFNSHIQDILQEAEQKFNVNFVHTYSNLIAESYVFDSHNDPMSILLVQCVGQVEYSFKDGTSYTLSPGDALYVPRGVYHKPRIFGPRVTFSYVWHYSR